MNTQTTLVASVVVALLVGAGAGYYLGTVSSATPLPEPPATAEETTNPLADVKTNPLEDVKTNPFENVKTNPFE